MTHLMRSKMMFRSRETHKSLHAAGEKHNTDWSTQRRWRKVLGELATSNTAGAMRATHTAPHDTETGVILHSLGAVHVHDSLVEVELQVVAILHTLDLDQGSVGLLVGQSPPVPSHDTLHVE